MENERKIKEIYRYEDEEGKLLFEVVRLEPKGFYQRRQDGKGGYVNNTTGVRKVPYKLPELIAAPLDEWVFVVEGEKDAERIIKEGPHGTVATTNPGGAGKWCESYNEFFRERYVAIVQDNDEPGRKHSLMVADSVGDVAKTVKIIDLRKAYPQLPAKGDVSDFFDAGYKFGDLSILVDDAPQYQPEEIWTKKADIVCAADVEPRKLEFVWPGRIPLAVPSILAGDPGTGKSYFTLYVATLVSRGGKFPDGTDCQRAGVLILSGEDSPDFTIRPRLDLLGADNLNVFLYRATKNKDPQDGSVYETTFSFADDLNVLEEALAARPQIRLVIIDPLSSYLGNVDCHKDGPVRRIMSDILRLATKYNVAVVCVMHLNKGTAVKAIYRIMGSLGFAAAARMVWPLSADPADPQSGRRLLLPSKNNLIENLTSLAFTLKEGQLIFEDKPVNITADEAISPRSNIEAPAKDQAIEFLKETLAGGNPVPSKQIEQLAKEAGISEITLKRAKKELGVKSYIEFDEQGERYWVCQLSGENKKPKTMKELIAQKDEMMKRLYEKKQRDLWTR